MTPKYEFELELLKSSPEDVSGAVLDALDSGATTSDVLVAVTDAIKEKENR